VPIGKSPSLSISGGTWRTVQTDDGEYPEKLAARLAN
jgi:hypothetical protein